MSKSKLSNSVKQLIAKRGAGLAPSSAHEHAQLMATLDRLHASSQIQTSKNALLTLATGALFSINSPSAIRSLWQWSGQTPQDATLLREAGLKCISFIGIAKVINNLAVLHQAFAEDGVQDSLSRRPRRNLRPSELTTVFPRGRALWDSIYAPHHDKLVAKLGSYHPDLPVHILESHYSELLSDPDPVGPLGRVLTSVLAIGCLQGTTGVGGQTTSHVFGLMKALDEDTDAHDDDSIPSEGLSLQEKRWLCADAGCEWALGAVEALRDVVDPDASGPKAKL